MTKKNLQLEFSGYINLSRSADIGYKIPLSVISSLPEIGTNPPLIEWSQSASASYFFNISDIS